MDHQHPKELVSRRWQRFVVWGNTILAGAEIATGRLNNLAVLADALHNAGDAYTYHIQCENVLDNKQLDESKINKRRKIAHSIIAGGSLAVATTATYELLNNVNEEIGYGTIAVAGLSVAFNSLVATKPLRAVLSRRDNGHGHSHSEKDILKHIGLVDMPSSVLALGGALAQKYNVDLAGMSVEHLSAIASGGLGAYAFRPTEKNLHGHSH